MAEAPPDTPDTTASAHTEDRVRLADREGFLAWVFLLPTVVYVIALVAVPFFLAIAFAFSDVTGGDPSYDWVGLTNFRRVFQDDCRDA